MTGLYVHIPFCKSRCVYCGFYSTTLDTMKEKYVDALIDELRLRTAEGQKWRTIYLGGGTPSCLDGRLLRKLFSAIDCSCSIETTIECNPDDVTDELADLLADLPVNRVSMGAQTFDDDRLRFLRRRHTSSDVACAVERLRRRGFGNVSIDLMYGFPGETIEDWMLDIDRALALGVEHLSAYCLMYEEGTPLFKMLEKGLVNEADEELSREMYYSLIDRLQFAGYDQYELSNFAHGGKRSIHNSSYWSGIPYVGIGAAAHSYDGRYRQWNIENLLIYINKVEKGELPFTAELLTLDEKYNDMVMLSLRTKEGIDLDKMSLELGEEARDFCVEQSRQYIRSGLMVAEGNSLRLSRDGLYVSDMVMSELMKV